MAFAMAVPSSLVATIAADVEVNIRMFCRSNEDERDAVRISAVKVDNEGERVRLERERRRREAVVGL